MKFILKPLLMAVFALVCTTASIVLYTVVLIAIFIWEFKLIRWQALFNNLGNPSRKDLFSNIDEEDEDFRCDKTPVDTFVRVYKGGLLDYGL